ncbi:MAG: hypothetical protein HDS41_07295 [Bacteroides sp.]|nr:hypothetical protein [Bacteroides sp.]
MTRKELADNIAITIREYIGYSYTGKPELKLRINPVTLFVTVITEDQMLSDIADSDETIEDAAAAERAAAEDATDYQVEQNPDFYPVKNLIKIGDGGMADLDHEAINAIAAKYCKD